MISWTKLIKGPMPNSRVLNRKWKQYYSNPNWGFASLMTASVTSMSILLHNIILKYRSTYQIMQNQKFEKILEDIKMSV